MTAQEKYEEASKALDSLVLSLSIDMVQNRAMFLADPAGAAEFMVTAMTQADDGNNTEFTAWLLAVAQMRLAAVKAVDA